MTGRYRRGTLASFYQTRIRSRSGIATILAAPEKIPRRLACDGHRRGFCFAVRADFFLVHPKKGVSGWGIRKGGSAKHFRFHAGPQALAADPFFGVDPKKLPFLAPQKSQKTVQILHSTEKKGDRVGESCLSSC